ncbi:prolipoprotein diacylglyceryl transferase [bacterium]|nr:prolipoprotein diacylglyceryl transferase [bacterium]
MSLFLANAWDIDRTNGFVNWFYSSEFVFGIAKYAVCILIGIILAYFICTKEGKKLGIDPDDVLICVTFVVPLSILGARIWYLFGDGIPTFKDYNSSYGFFTAVLYTILYTFGYDPVSHYFGGLAGLAIHGGVLVAAIMSIICSRWKKWKISIVGDMVAPGLLIGQICGRWGNFFNQEAHGIVIGGWELNESTGELIPNLTVEEQYLTMTQKFHIPKFISNFMYMNEGGRSYYYGIVDGVQSYGRLEGSNFFHPTFLYESLLNLLGLIIYFVLRRFKKTRSGFFAGFYLIWYGIVRFFIEIIRTDSLYLPGTTLKSAQVTSIVMILIGILILVYIYFIKKTDYYTEIIERVKRENEISMNKDDTQVIDVK